MPPARQATRRYPDLASFVAEYESTLSKGVLLLPADQASGELAPEIKLDLALPLVGRVGPVLAQVVARLPDGSMALRLPEIPASVDAGFKRVFEIIEEVRGFLVSTGRLQDSAPVAEVIEDEVVEEDIVGDEVVEDEGVEDEGGEEEQTAELAPAGELPPDDAGTEERSAATTTVEDEIVEDEIVEDEIVDDELSALRSEALRVRGIPWVDTSRLQSASRGSMGDGSLRRALIGLALGREQGVLVIETPDGRLRLGYWRAGGPVAWRAEPPAEDELLGALLVRSGQLQQAQLDAALVEMERSGRRLGEVLVAAGQLPAQQLGPVLTRQAEFVLMRVLQEKGGTWAFFALPQLPASFETPPVPVAAVLLRAFVNQARRLQSAQLRAALKKLLPLTLTLSPEAVLALRELRYSREEASVLDALRVGEASVQAIVEKGDAPFEVGAALVWALSELGLLTQISKEAREDRLQRVAALLERKKKHATRGGPFEVLELSWICLPQEIERSRDRLRRELSPDALGELSPELQALAREVNTAVDAAASLLMDPARRRYYRRMIIAPEDLARSVELLREAAEEARRTGDAARAAVAEAKAAEISG